MRHVGIETNIPGIRVVVDGDDINEVPRNWLGLGDRGELPLNQEHSQHEGSVGFL